MPSSGVALCCSFGIDLQGLSFGLHCCKARCSWLTLSTALLQMVLRFSHLALPIFTDLTAATQRAWSVDVVEALAAAPMAAWALSLLLSSSSWAQALQPKDYASGPFLLVRSFAGLGEHSDARLSLVSTGNSVRGRQTVVTNSKCACTRVGAF